MRADVLRAGFDWAALPEGSKVVDVGGGVGNLTMALAKVHKHIKYLRWARWYTTNDACYGPSAFYPFPDARSPTTRCRSAPSASSSSSCHDPVTRQRLSSILLVDPWSLVSSSYTSW